MNELELQKINKHYGKKHALCDFSYTFTNGIYGLLGPNGAGKSTLMNMITDNLLPDPDGGKILYNGEETCLLKDRFRSRLGFMPQQQNIYESMTAHTFLSYIASLKCLDRKSAEAEIPRIVERVELTESIDKKMGGFSGGMKQRVLIAAAMLGDPDLLILDEPTAGLDPKQRVIIRNMVSEFPTSKLSRRRYSSSRRVTSSTAALSPTLLRRSRTAKNRLKTCICNTTARCRDEASCCRAEKAVQP